MKTRLAVDINGYYLRNNDQEIVEQSVTLIKEFPLGFVPFVGLELEFCVMSIDNPDYIRYLELLKSTEFVASNVFTINRVQFCERTSYRAKHFALDSHVVCRSPEEYESIRDQLVWGYEFKAKEEFFFVRDNPTSSTS